MNRVKASGAMLAVMVTAAVPGVLADAKGRVNVKGASFTVADAVAYKDGDDIEVALLPAAFNRKDAVKDRKIDSFDVPRVGTDTVAVLQFGIRATQFQKACFDLWNWLELQRVLGDRKGIRSQEAGNQRSR